MLVTGPGHRIQFTEHQLCHWAGLGDFQLVSPNGEHVLELTYRGEPAHGDSYHQASIDGRAYPGYVWGCMFTFSPCSRYLAFSAMPEKWARATHVVDLEAHCYAALPSYLHQVNILWPTVVGAGASSEGKRYTFSGTETWLAY